MRSNAHRPLGVATAGGAGTAPPRLAARADRVVPVPTQLHAHAVLDSGDSHRRPSQCDRDRRATRKSRRPESHATTSSSGRAKSRRPLTMPPRGTSRSTRRDSSWATSEFRWASELLSASLRHRETAANLGGAREGYGLPIMCGMPDVTCRQGMATFKVLTFGNHQVKAPRSRSNCNPCGPGPESSSGRMGEVALDTQWAYAIAPAANILLVVPMAETLGVHGVPNTMKAGQ